MNEYKRLDAALLDFRSFGELEWVTDSDLVCYCCCHRNRSIVTNGRMSLCSDCYRIPAAKRAIVGSAGSPVPQGELLYRGTGFTKRFN